MRAVLGLREETRRGRKKARARGYRDGDNVAGPKSGRGRYALRPSVTCG